MVESRVLAVLDEGEPRARLAGSCKARLVVGEGGLCRCAPPPPREREKEGWGRPSCPVLSPEAGSAGLRSSGIPVLTFPAGCICTGSWGEARSPGAGCRAWGCMGRREDCREESQDLRQPGAPLGRALPLTSQDAILTESEKPVCWLACSICFCKDRAPPGWRKPRRGRGRVRHEQSAGKGSGVDAGGQGQGAGQPHLSGWAGSGHALRRAGAAAETGTALPGTLKALREAGAQAVGPPSGGWGSWLLPLFPLLTSELLTGAVGRLGGSVVRWGLSRPVGTTRAALELTVLWGPRESRCRAHVVPGLWREEER